MAQVFITKWSNPALQINLRRPDYGNQWSVETRVKQVRNMNGKLFTFKADTTIYKISMRFSHLDARKRFELEYFLEQTAGEEVRLFDWNGLQWRGRILTDPIEFTDDTRGRQLSSTADNVFVSVQLEFEGTRLRVA